MSLLEVLMSIGIIGVGLLGVVALFPVAGRQVSHGTTADRVAALGREKWIEFMVRGLDDPAQIEGNYEVTHCNTCIDPLYCITETNGTTWPSGGRRRFPDLENVRMMLRKTLVYSNTASPAPISTPLAKEIFLCKDDLKFNTNATNLSEMPVQSLDVASGRRRNFNGEYSWFAMLLARTTSSYRLAVVIVKNRDYMAAQSLNDGRVASVTWVSPLVAGSGALANGEANLSAPDTNGNGYPDELDVKVGEWIFLYRMAAGANYGTASDVYADWYEVVGAEPAVLTSGAWNRRVTLQGPDYGAASSGTTMAPNFCVLVKGAVGVYERGINSHERAKNGMFSPPKYTKPPPQ